MILTGPKGAVLARRSAVGSLVGRRTSVGRRIAVGRRSLLACRRLRLAQVYVFLGSLSTHIEEGAVLGRIGSRRTWAGKVGLDVSRLSRRFLNAIN